MQVIGDLKPGQDFRLLAPFKTLPLFNLLARMGFSHFVQPLEGGEWEVIFSQKENLESLETGPENQTKNSRGTASMKPLIVDARGLEPPQPLVTILEALAILPERATLHALTDRRPMPPHLQLTERGFTGESEEQPDGNFITYIHRR